MADPTSETAAIPALAGPKAGRPERSKRGLAWAWNNTAADFDIYLPGVHEHKLTWLFNWELWRPDGFPMTLEYVGQVRTANEIPQLTNLGAERGLRYLLGFNEPDNSGQANMTAVDAVAFWKEHILPAKHRLHLILGSPAVTNGESGKPWLREFFRLLEGADEVEFLPVHWYGLDVEYFKTYLTDMHNTFKLDIWVTEFAFAQFEPKYEPSASEVQDFFKEAIKFLEPTPWIKRYAYFGAPPAVGPEVGEANKFANGCRLTNLGKLYVEL